MSNGNRRRTKIVATLGPALSDAASLSSVIAAGVDLVRINFSHGAAEEHLERARIVREEAAKLGKEVGILADLQGPKIRVEGFREGKVPLLPDQEFVLDLDLERDAGTEQVVGVSYPDLIKDLRPGSVLLLDDGRIALEVQEIEKRRVITRVVQAGILGSRKGLNLKGGGLSAPALTDKDREDIRTAARMGADYVAVSFCRSGEDMHEARKLVEAAGSRAGIMAKIERAEARARMLEIIEASDAIMVARGDLGVEIGDAKLPAVQKQLIRSARAMNRAVITATQMMESMISNPTPTRAEVFDVANAVLDGTDAVMLSAETAVGKYPDRTVAAMAGICLEAEQHRLARTSDHRMDSSFSRVDEAIAMSAMYAANHLHVAALAAMTESGTTALYMSRISSGIPIFAVSRRLETVRRMTLYRGVYPVHLEVSTENADDQHKLMLDELVRREMARPGDLVITSCGDVRWEHGGTNNLKINVVPDGTS